MRVNKQLRAFTTSQAFNLSLNQVGLETLLDMYYWVKYISRNNSQSQAGYTIQDRRTSSYLQRRGLIKDSKDIRINTYCLTKAGKLTSELLLEAGFESMNTPVRQQLEWAEANLASEEV